jgi:aminoglycoside phosphotransferase (APT) family kinase protein
VYRSAGPWTAAVHDLLRHLEAVGFDGAPRVVGDGTQDGREVLTFVAGELVHPHAWNDDGVAAVGRLLREFHDAAATFRVPSGAVWQPWFVRDDGASSIVGHGEPAPWNIIARDGKPAAFIDWEFAGPVDRLDEVAHAAWLNCQLHDDDIAVMHQLPSVERRVRQLRCFLDGYGLDASERIGFVKRMIYFAVRACAHEAIDAQVTPNSTDSTSLWALAWRARSAAWMIRHESILNAALYGAHA